MGAGVRAGRGEGGEWRGPRGRLRCVLEAAKHNFPPLLPPGPGSCCRPRRRRRRCCCCSSRCCSSPGSVVGEALRPARAEGGATEGPGAAAGPAALLSGAAVVFGGWLHARGPWTLAGNFSPRPGRGPGRARAGECGAGRPLPSPPPRPRSEPRCLPGLGGDALCADSSVCAPRTVTFSLTGAGSRGHGLAGWGCTFAAAVFPRET